MRKILIKFFCLLMIIGQLVSLTGCLNSFPDGKDPSKIQAQSKVYFEYFDTVSTIFSYAGDKQEEFENNSLEVSEILEKYHSLFDIYHEYAGINNLATINKNAGGEPIVVDDELIHFLLNCKSLYLLTNGKTNVMMGSVLKLWHDARTHGIDFPDEAKLPDMDLLKEASLHTSIELLEINVENKTVRITDPKASIDVGAIGKGYATEKAAQYLENKGCNSYVLNIGGNIRIIGAKVDGTGWLTGVKDPHYKNPSGYAFYTRIKDTSCVTSGDYERYYTVNNVRYHHIIDQTTLMPANYFSSVTIITKDSGLADALSTALFCMSYEEGLNLVNKIGGVEVLWIFKDGSQQKTDGMIAENLEQK